MLHTLDRELGSRGEGGGEMDGIKNLGKLRFSGGFGRFLGGFHHPDRFVFPQPEQSTSENEL